VIGSYIITVPVDVVLNMLLTNPVLNDRLSPLVYKL